MTKSVFKKPLILSIIVLAIPMLYVNAVTTFTIDFNGLTQQTNTYTEDGFVLTCDASPSSCAFNVGFTAGNPPPNMFPALASQVNTLSRQNDGEFDLISIDVRELSPCCVNSKPINFTAVKMAGGTVSQTFNTDGTFGWETFVFNGFTNITSVSWDEINPVFFGAFDNIVLEIADGQPPNSLPICSNALPSQATLWPPNHKFVNISVNGITDPDGDSVTIEITKIEQDEPTNGLGDGDQSPDGIINGDTAQVRAERSGNEDGRVYETSFTADDGKGGTCNGSVLVSVPHDKKDIAIDSGIRFDSTS